MTTPTASNTALAKDELRCAQPNFCGPKQQKKSECVFGCAVKHRPGIALALQQKDDDAAREIDRLKGEIGKLRAALEPFATTADNYDDPRDPDWAEPEFPGISLGDLRKARAALQTEGEKL